VRRVPAVAVFTGTALLIALTAGAGLGLWLLFARLYEMPLFDISWVVLVQVHGMLQLFGFAALFVMGVGLHVVPRFRGASAHPAPLIAAIYVTTVCGLALRAVAQPATALPARELVLIAGAAALLTGTALYAAAALRTLASGRNDHRPDELVIGIGACALPAAALLAATGVFGAPLVVDPVADDRAVWLMLLGALSITIFGVWARLAPAFAASLPVRYPPLFAGLASWMAGIAGLLLGLALAPWALLAGLALIAWALGVFGPTIARQALAQHARLTRLAVQSAFFWAFVGVLILVASGGAVVGDGYLVISAARHAFALGFVTLMIFGVGARAIPAFLDRPLCSPALQLAAIALTNAGVALRAVPQALGGSDPATSALIGLSGALAYAGLVAFAVNVARTLASRPAATAIKSGSVPIQVRFTS
jgi:uncharacterized protein involved in response to NO